MKSSTIWKFLSKLGINLLNDFLLFKSADGYTHETGKNNNQEILFKERVENIMRESKVLKIKDLSINGRDIIRILKIKVRTKVGLVLNKILEKVIENSELNNRKKLLKLISQIKV